MKNTFLSYLRYLALCMLMFTLSVEATPAEASAQSFVRLSGHIPDRVMARATFLENLDANTHIPVTFVLPLRNQQALEELINRIYDPTDQEYYGKYLSSEEFIERFSPTQEDYDKVIAYAKELGLNIVGTHPNRVLLNVSAPANSIEAAFKLKLHQYQLPNGHKFHAPNNDPEVPISIASLISGVVGLDNHAVWRPFHRLKEEVNEMAHSASEATPQASPSGPGGGFSPRDLEIAYNLSGVSANGSGQSIALFQLAAYQVSDINEYTKSFGLPSAKLTNVLVDGGSGSGINAEVTLDIELALALAPESQIYVYEGPNSAQGVLNTYNRIATDNIAKQVSTSWGLGEDLVSAQFLQAENAIFMQMAAHGQTIYAAAGDSGAYDDSPSTNLAVDDPASQPYVTGVGGTKLAVDSTTGTYQNEVVWNEGPNNGAGGGGVSKVWPIPAWQTKVSTAHSKTNRNVPDISLNADPNTGYSIYHNGQWAIYGGTSCAAPLWAAFTARVNQQRLAAQLPVLGFANPTLYAIGAGASQTTNFHDVTSGDNLYYQAHTGYDNATGWGSFNGVNLFAALTNSSPPPPPPPQDLPILNMTMKHHASFIRGKTGIYQINITNNGHASTSGPVKVTIHFPPGLQPTFFRGAGWFFSENELVFIQDEILDPGQSYPSILLYVKVSRHASHLETPTATVSGGGSVSSTVSDPTVIR